MRESPCSSWEYDIAFSPLGRLVATAAGTARIWDTRRARFGRPLPVLRSPADLWKVTFAPDGETLLTMSDDGSARLWRAATGEQLAVFRGPPGQTRGAFSPSGKLVATSGPGGVRVWAADAAPTRFARRLPPRYPKPPVSAITFAGDGSHLVAEGAGAWTLETGTGRIRHAFLPTSLPDGLVSVSPDGRLVANGQGIRNAATGRWRWRTQLQSAAFSRDSTRLAFVDGDGRVGVWTARSGEARALGRADGDAVGFAPGGGVVTLGAEDMRLVWPVGGGRPRKARPGEGPYDAVARVGGLAATLGDAGVRLWRDGKAAGILATGRLFGAEASSDVALSPDSRSAAIVPANGIARVWDVATSASLALRHVGGVNSVSFSPGGQLVVTAGKDGTARVWQAATGASVAVLGAGGEPVTAAEFSPDGRFVATGDADRVVRLYDYEATLADLLQLARSRATRKLTPQERREFLGGE